MKGDKILAIVAIAVLVVLAGFTLFADKTVSGADPAQGQPPAAEQAAPKVPGEGNTEADQKELHMAEVLHSQMQQDSAKPVSEADLKEPRSAEVLHSQMQQDSPKANLEADMKEPRTAVVLHKQLQQAWERYTSSIDRKSELESRKNSWPQPPASATGNCDGIQNAAQRARCTGVR